MLIALLVITKSYQEQLSEVYKPSHITPGGFPGMSGALESHPKAPCFFTHPPQGACHLKCMANSHSLILSSMLSVRNFNPEGELN